MNNNENDQANLIEMKQNNLEINRLELNGKELSTPNEHHPMIENFFKITFQQIDKFFESYMKGKRDLEVEEIKQHGSTEGLLEKLKSNPSAGLSGTIKMNKIIPDDEIQRINEFSDNLKIEAPLTTCCQHAIDALKDLMLQLLIVAAIVQIILGSIPAISEDPSKEWVEGFSIIVAVSVVVSVGSITNFSKEKAFKELNKKSQDELEVSLIRNGENRVFHPNDILVGDVLKFTSGKTISVDGILLNGHTVEMDESPLTGESNRMKKVIFNEVLKEFEVLNSKNQSLDHLSSSLIFSGTKCVKGSGDMLVLRVGKNSEIGKIEGRIAAEDGTNSLEEKLDKLAGDVGKFGMCAALVTLTALLIRFGVGYHISKVKYENYFEKKQNSTDLNTSILNISNSSLNETQNIDPNAPQDPALTVGHQILTIILLCVAIIVVAIPEGLPLAVTLSLAFAIAKMQKENNLVRSMTSCETMGSANYVCTDKTGTLTQNLMKIEKFYNLDNNKRKEELGIGSKNSSKICLFQNNTDSEYQKIVEQAISINISIAFEEKNGQKELLRDCNPTDKSFYDFLQDRLKIDYFQAREKYFTEGNNVKIIPFTSETKCMTTLIKHPSFGIGGWRVFIKGGPDVILPKAKYLYNKDSNKPDILSEDKINQIGEMINDFASDSLRTIGLAYKDVDDKTADDFEKTDLNGALQINKDEFILLGIVGIKDPLKEGVTEAVKNCKTSGITVIMVTGDNIVTARAIAEECGIIDKFQSEILIKELNKEENKRKTKSTEFIEKSNIALLGPDFSDQVGLICDNEKCKNPVQNLSNNINNENIELCKCFVSEYEKDNAIKKNPDDDSLRNKPVRKERIANLQLFKKIVENLKIIARAQPIDKYILVSGLKALGNVVAVTGDGTNDAQALSKADVGFAMGKAGTDIAKDASDIILLDDNFASIITAVKFGRNIFDCIRKFIQFQLTVNLCACLLVFITACIGNETPLTAIQMLWVNLIMDSLGSLALATEPPNEKKLLGRRPYGRNEYIVNKTMWKHIIGQAFVQLGLMLFLYLFSPQFIRESNISKIAEADLIKLCFGKYPGRDPDDSGYFILDGSINAWDTSTTILPGKGVDLCGTSYGAKTNLYTAHSLFSKNNGNSTHLTIIFNTFVLYTLFNQLCARVIDDSFNMFLDIQKNLYFILIEFAEFGLHAVLIQFSGPIFKCAKGGLTAYQWGICFGFGAISFVVNFVLKLFLRHNDKNNFIDDSDKDQKINEDEKLLVINDKILKEGSKERSMFNPMIMRSSGSRQADLKQFFQKPIKENI